MTRFPHDQFAKDYLKELLSPLGEVETSRDVPGEVRELDVFFTPISISLVLSCNRSPVCSRYLVNRKAPSPLPCAIYQ